MSLASYRAKRNFSSTPEPAGTSPRPRQRGPFFFCVQKHLASHLHYDFRLEHEGVLLSWAVPKGPALDPSVRRLAMQVEDHPIEYGEFEGIIPEGYGAGIVMLWDRGTWEPEVEDVAAALAKGDLKFRLDGYKLKGSWVLVRTRGQGERGWILIKHRDEWAGPVDIAEFAPHSVKSGGDFADILAQHNPSIWISNRPAKGGDAGAMFERIVKRALEMKGSAGTATRKTPAAAEPAPASEAVGAKEATRGRKTTPAGKTARARKTTGARKAVTSVKKTTGARKSASPATKSPGAARTKVGTAGRQPAAPRGRKAPGRAK